MSWIDENWNMVETLVDFIEIKGAHSGENMASAIWGSLETYELINLVGASHSMGVLQADSACAFLSSSP